MFILFITLVRGWVAVAISGSKIRSAEMVRFLVRVVNRINFHVIDHQLNGKPNESF